MHTCVFFLLFLCFFEMCSTFWCNIGGKSGEAHGICMDIYWFGVSPTKQLQSILYNVQKCRRILVRVVANAALYQVRALAEQTLETVSLQNCPQCPQSVNTYTKTYAQSHTYYTRKCTQMYSF